VQFGFGQLGQGVAEVLLLPVIEEVWSSHGEGGLLQRAGGRGLALRAQNERADPYSEERFQPPGFHQGYNSLRMCRLA